MIVSRRSSAGARELVAATLRKPNTISRRASSGPSCSALADTGHCVQGSEYCRRSLGSQHRNERSSIRKVADGAPAPLSEGGMVNSTLLPNSILAESGFECDFDILQRKSPLALQEFTTSSVGNITQRLSVDFNIHQRQSLAHAHFADDLQEQDGGTHHGSLSTKRPAAISQFSFDAGLIGSDPLHPSAENFSSRRQSGGSTRRSSAGRHSQASTCWLPSGRQSLHTSNSFHSTRSATDRRKTTRRSGARHSQGASQVWQELCAGYERGSFEHSSQTSDEETEGSVCRGRKNAKCSALRPSGYPAPQHPAHVKSANQVSSMKRGTYFGLYGDKNDQTLLGPEMTSMFSSGLGDSLMESPADSHMHTIEDQAFKKVISAWEAVIDRKLVRRDQKYCQKGLKPSISKSPSERGVVFATDALVSKTASYDNVCSPASPSRVKASIPQLGPARCGKPQKQILVSPSLKPPWPKALGVNINFWDRRKYTDAQQGAPITSSTNAPLPQRCNTVQRRLLKRFGVALGSWLPEQASTSGSSSKKTLAVVPIPHPATLAQSDEDGIGSSGDERFARDSADNIKDGFTDEEYAFQEEEEEEEEEEGEHDDNLPTDARMEWDDEEEASQFSQMHMKDADAGYYEDGDGEWSEGYD